MFISQACGTTGIAPALRPRYSRSALATRAAKLGGMLAERVNVGQVCSRLMARRANLMHSLTRGAAFLVYGPHLEQRVGMEIIGAQTPAGLT